MTTNKTSIIIQAFDNSIIERAITWACIDCIHKYTDDYEIILIDQGKIASLDSWNTRDASVDQHIIPEQDMGYSWAMNKGAELATGEYLCFMHNDIFVSEGWLLKLIRYIKEEKGSFVVPTTCVVPREYVKKYAEMTHEEIKDIGGYYDAGMIVMSRAHYDTTDGWDNDLRCVYHGAAFADHRGGRGGFGLWATPEVILTHIGQTQHYDLEKTEKNTDRENEIYHNRYLDNQWKRLR